MAGKHLNIAMFGHKHMLSREGGIDIVVFNLSSRLAEKGHKVVCYDRSTRYLSGSPEPDDVRLITGVGCLKVVTVPTIEKKGFAALTSSFIAGLLAAGSSADVVHIHAEGPAAMCGLVKFISSLFGRPKRVIVTVHGLDWQRAKWGRIAGRFIKFGEKQAAKHADDIIVLSKGMQKYFAREYGRKTVFIPNGVTKPEIVPAQEITEKWRLEKDSYVLFLARIVPEKGLRYLIEAWKGVRTDKKLVIAGGSSDTADFVKELKEMSAGDNRIIFTGFQQGRVLEELYSNAYIYCLPSDLEGMPLSLLEAMSYGNCCVVSDIAEMTEIVEDKAAVFPHSSSEELRKTLQRLLDDPKSVNKYKTGAADFITAKYGSWDDVADRTLEIYSK